jgi:hypothetical protein
MSKAVASLAEDVGPTEPAGVVPGVTVAGGGGGAGAVWLTPDGDADVGAAPEDGGGKAEEGLAGAAVCAAAVAEKRRRARDAAASNCPAAPRARYGPGNVTFSVYLESRRIASSSPLMVRGYMR